MFLRATAIVALAASSAAANDFLNPSFELGTFVANGDNAYIIAAGNTDLAGWTVVNQVAWISTPNPFSLTASDGIRFLDLTSYAGVFGGVSQDVATFNGSQCHVEFDQGSFAGYGNSFLSVIASDSQGVIASQQYIELGGSVSRWDSKTFDFVAREATTTITFMHDFQGDNYTGLDNVSLTQVPAPASLTLIALAGLASRRRR